MNESTRILVVDDEHSVREMISIMMRREGYVVHIAQHGNNAIEMLESGDRFDLVITDLAMDRGSGLDVLKEVKARDPHCPVILITAFGSTETAVEAMKNGAHDYIAKPFNVDEFKLIVKNALAHRFLLRENLDLKEKVYGTKNFADVVGHSEAMKDIIAISRRVADSSTSVFISGESGTGKEVLSRAIHHSSSRAQNTFVPVNCGALPEHLMESELFGHAKGSFTGATAEKEGLFKSADRGTLFLDEIGELPLSLQVKLLRVLQEKTIRPVGTTDEIPVDVRIISATNQNLEELVGAGLFRTDLYYRLNVLNIYIPPLRERKVDIDPLISKLLPQIAKEVGSTVTTLSPETMRILQNYDFPGNVRELKNILERALTLAAGARIEVADLPATVLGGKSDAVQGEIALPETGIDLDAALGKIERTYIDRALASTDGVQSAAANLLGITVRSLRYRLAKADNNSPADS